MTHTHLDSVSSVRDDAVWALWKTVRLSSDRTVTDVEPIFERRWDAVEALNFYMGARTMHDRMVRPSKRCWKPLDHPLSVRLSVLSACGEDDARNAECCGASPGHTRFEPFPPLPRSHTREGCRHRIPHATAVRAARRMHCGRGATTTAASRHPQSRRECPKVRDDDGGVSGVSEGDANDDSRSLWATVH